MASAAHFTRLDQPLLAGEMVTFGAILTRGLIKT
jgi:hypothetical protein